MTAKFAESVKRTPNDAGRDDLLIDGEPFPWAMTVDGPTVSYLRGVEDLCVVYIPILVDMAPADAMSALRPTQQQLTAAPTPRH